MGNITDLFTCSRCGGHWIEEIRQNCTSVTVVLGIRDDGSYIYGATTTEGGKPRGYRCMSCRRELRDNRDLLITNLSEILKQEKSIESRHET